MTIAPTGHGELQISATEARALTDRIKTGLEVMWSLITQAHQERADVALGYSSWDEYCTREFGASRIRIPREERSEIVASLRESGLSTRAIAAATGLSQPTISRELSSAPTDSNESVRPVTGLNGKTYSPRHQTTFTDESGEESGGIVDDRDPGDMSDQDWIDAAHDADAFNEPEPGSEPEPEQAKPRRRPLEEGFFDATMRLSKAVTSLENLGNDDRLPRNKEKVARYRADLLRAINALQCVADQLNK